MKRTANRTREPNRESRSRTGDATNEPANLGEVLTALRDEVARLSERVAALEAASRAQVAPPRAGAPAEEPISEAVLAVLSAAVAAYLGKKPRIRSVRILSSPEWARQGRAHIQASHVLGRR